MILMTRLQAQEGLLPGCPLDLETGDGHCLEGERVNQRIGSVVYRVCEPLLLPTRVTEAGWAVRGPQTYQADAGSGGIALRAA
jgi:hypothetical protein